MTLEPVTAPAPKNVNWKQIGLFLGLTFALTWGLNLALYLTGGLKSGAAMIALQLQMLLPAFSAILLGMFVFKDSPINIQNNRKATRWFTWYFLVFTLLYIAAVVTMFIRPDLITAVSSVMMPLSLIGLILLIVVRVRGGKDALTSIGMGGGRPILWLLFGLGVVAFFGLQALLNWLIGLGKPADLSALFAAMPPTGMSQDTILALLAFQVIVLGPFLGLLVSFGEEYGWRGYLQPALYGLGKVKAVALLGVIWGIWHWPVIWMGYNFPGNPVLGSLLMVLYCEGLGFFLGYAVLKAKGVWIAAFLHALSNQALSYFAGMVYTPNDMAWSFGIGVPGLGVLALVVLLILRDPVWKDS
jgi:membrane protease YdiL (CAAX protease family)